MQHQHIWDKVLNPSEKVAYEFSISSTYRTRMMISLLIISGLFCLAILPLGIIMGAIVAFYFGWYIKQSNAYAFTDTRVLVHQGWLSTKLISTEYQKITNVTVTEPFLGRMAFKTGSISIDTAGTGTSEIVLNNIEAPYEIKKKLDALRIGK
jgi:uncharacterized membrane protein YdbT with pleckstrin-like domain